MLDIRRSSRGRILVGGLSIVMVLFSTLPYNPRCRSLQSIWSLEIMCSKIFTETCTHIHGFLMYGHIDCYKVCTNSIARWTLTSQGGRRLAEEEKLEQVTHVRRDLPIQPFLSTERQRQGLGSVIHDDSPLSRLTACFIPTGQTRRLRSSNSVSSFTDLL